MAAVVYTVIAEFEDEATLRAYLAWLTGGHAAAVVAAGALSAEVIGPLAGPTGALEGPLRLDCRYTFPTLGAFRAYETDHAPRLRAEGAALFGAVQGLRVSRSLGTRAAVFGGPGPSGRTAGDQ